MDIAFFIVVVVSRAETSGGSFRPYQGIVWYSIICWTGIVDAQTVQRETYVLVAILIVTSYSGGFAVRHGLCDT